MTKRKRIPGLIRAGDSPWAAGARAMMARRRAMYGPNGLSPAGAAKLRELARHLPHQPVTHCRKYGHRYTVANTYSAPNGKRRCRACRVLWDHRRRWAKHQVGKLAALKTAMIRAHPDRGGTHVGFIRARKRYLAAMKQLAAGEPIRNPANGWR